MQLHRQLPMTIALGAIATAVALFEPVVRPASAGGGGCHGAPQTEGAGDQVTMVHGCFEPTVLRTEPGTTVTFRNTDAWLHNVHGQTWNLPGDFMKETTRALAFPLEGTFPYACAYHPGMVGVIVVGDGIMDAATTGGVQSSRLADAESNETVTAAQQDATGTDRPRSTAPWSAAAFLTGAISAGAGGFLFGKRRRP